MKPDITTATYSFGVVAHAAGVTEPILQQWLARCIVEAIETVYQGKRPLRKFSLLDTIRFAALQDLRLAGIQPSDAAPIITSIMAAVGQRLLGTEFALTSHRFIVVHSQLGTVFFAGPEPVQLIGALMADAYLSERFPAGVPPEEAARFKARGHPSAYLVIDLDGVILRIMNRLEVKQ